jgi:hypothetical protein
MARLKVDLAVLPTMEARGVASEVIELTPHELGAMRVKALLGAMAGWGTVKVARVCKRAAVDPLVRLDELDPDQKTELIGILRGPRNV